MLDLESTAMADDAQIGTGEISVEKIMEEISRRAEARRSLPETADLLRAIHEPSAQLASLRLYSLGRLYQEVAASNLFQDSFRTVAAEPPCLKKKVKQFAKKAIFRLFRWYLWPLQEFHRAVAASLTETVNAIDNLQTNLAAVAHELKSAKENGGQASSHDLQAPETPVSGGSDGRGQGR
jgi:hypothetical protein